MAENTASQIARSILHLNFNEPEKALEVLFEALTDINFQLQKKENADGHAAA